MSTEWEQLCLFCGGTGIDEENSFPASGPSWDSMGEPGWMEPCICQFDIKCSCGFGLYAGGECTVWCGNGHQIGLCPPIYVTLRLGLDEEYDS